MIYDLDAFFGALAVAEIDLYPSDARVLGNFGGSILPNQVGDRLWQGMVRVNPAPHAKARVIGAKINALTTAGAVFLATPFQAESGGQTGTVSAIGSDRRNVTLSGLSVSVGDYVGTFGNRVRGLHQVLEVSGGSVRFDLPVPRQIPAGSVATTDQPQFLAVASVGVRGPSYGAALSNEFSFEFTQSLMAEPE